MKSNTTTPTYDEDTMLAFIDILGFEDLVRDMAQDLERDCDSTFRIYRELNQQRKALKSLREELEEQQGLLK